MKTTEISIHDEVIMTRQDVYVEMGAAMRTLRPNLMISKGAKGRVGHLESADDNVTSINVIFALSSFISVEVWLSPGDVQITGL